ncbi:MAG: hypothetical protein ACWGSQ_02900 [Longimicrobiales bacterium]
MTPDTLRIDISDMVASAPGRSGQDEPPGPDRDPRRGIVSAVLRWIALLIFLAVLPFFTLVRVSVFLFQDHGLGSWPALGGGSVATVLLLVLYLMAVSIRVGGKGRVPASLLKSVGVLVGAYCVFTLLYLSAGNAKTAEIRSTYTALNPLLRVGVSTLLLADREGVLTATGRSLEDYAAWGLSANEASLHLPREDGYVYAVDIRTRGRPEWRNRLVTLYFRAMGYGTLRHVGTADHLHVYLEPRGGS